MRAISVLVGTLVLCALLVDVRAKLDLEEETDISEDADLEELLGSKSQLKSMLRRVTSHQKAHKSQHRAHKRAAAPTVSPTVVSARQSAAVVLDGSKRLVTPEPLDTPTISINAKGLDNNWVADNAIIASGNPVPKVNDPNHVSPIIDGFVSGSNSSEVDRVVRKYTSPAQREDKRENPRVEEGIKEAKSEAKREADSIDFSGSSPSQSKPKKSLRQGQKEILEFEKTILDKLSSLENTVERLRTRVKKTSAKNSTNKLAEKTAAVVEEKLLTDMQKVTRDAVIGATSGAVKKQTKKVNMELEELKTYLDQRRAEDKADLQNEIGKVQRKVSLGALATNGTVSKGAVKGLESVIKQDVAQELQSVMRSGTDKMKKTEAALESSLRSVVPDIKAELKQLLHQQTKQEAKVIQKVINASTSGADAQELKKLLNQPSPVLLETLRMARKVAESPVEDE